MNACWTGTVNSATPQDLKYKPLERCEQWIPDGKMIVFENLFGRTLICVQGRVWVTQENDARDIVLGPGQQFQLDRSGKAVVQSLERSCVAVA